MSEERKSGMRESIGLTITTSILDLISALSFIFDMKSKLDDADAEGLHLPISWALIIILYCCCALNVITTFVSVWAYSTELMYSSKELKHLGLKNVTTFRFEKKKYAYAAFGIDFVANVVAACAGTILFHQFDL